jgi:hypothetical protein
MVLFQKQLTNSPGTYLSQRYMTTSFLKGIVPIYNNNKSLLKKIKKTVNSSFILYII